MKLSLGKSQILYDLATDLPESDNMAKAHPEVIRHLTEQAEMTRHETNIPRGK